MRREFPEAAAFGSDALSRRRFLALMGASLALAGLSGCSVKPAPSTEIVPYVHPPEGMGAGRPLFFATTMSFAGNAVGLLVESHTGRPTKIEGNPNHPASRGATDIFNQASVLTLYDPDRAQTVTQQGETRTWGEAASLIRAAMQEQRGRRGAGFRLLTETVISPTLARQIEDLLKALPEAKWHVWEPIHRDMARQGAELAFGEAVNPVYDFHKADVVLSLDADFLQCGPGNLRYAADFMDRRRAPTTKEAAGQATMNRLYVVETTVTCTGAKADHRLAVRPAEIEDIARAIAAKLGVLPAGGSAGRQENWVSAVARDLERHRGRCLVLAGDRQPPAVHLLAHALNEHLGNVGQTVTYTEPIDARPGDRTQSLRELVHDMEQGRVEFLMILGGNPVYNAPADLKFAEHLEKVPLRMHHGLYVDETSLLCHWHLPETHYLEAWSDARAYDGTASIVQPLIEPLYACRSAHELLALMTDFRITPGLEIVRDHWRQWWEGRQEKVPFAHFWQKILHDGVIPDTALPPKTVKLKKDWQETLSLHRTRGGGRSKDTSELEILFLPDPTLYDGSWANNGWMQELPKPLSKLAWGNAAIVSPATARQLGVDLGSYAHGGEHGGYYMPLADLTLDGRTLRAPVWIMPGQADGVVALYLGNGREHAGRVGGSAAHRVGVNAYRLRTAERPWFAAGLRAVKTSEREIVACTQAHQTMESREPVRTATLAEFRANPGLAGGSKFKEEHPEIPEPREAITLYDSYDYAPPKHRWGMAIDLTACIGCHACVVACQAENNIPVVGKEQVSPGPGDALAADRPLHHGHGGRPRRLSFSAGAVHALRKRPLRVRLPGRGHGAQRRGAQRHGLQPLRGHAVLLEQLSLQGAAVQLPLLFRLYDTPSRRLQYNPDVTVRSRGVMEKCSYCVQRIRRAEIDVRDRGPSAGRRRSAHRLPGRLPDAGDRVRRHERSARSIVRLERTRRWTTVCWPTEHPSADHVSGRIAESQPRTGDVAWLPTKRTTANVAGTGPRRRGPARLRPARPHTRHRSPSGSAIWC